MNVSLTSSLSASTHVQVFNNNTFEEKFNHGWLKWYFYCIIACFVISVAFFIVHIVRAFEELQYGFGFFMAYIFFALLSLVSASFYFCSYQAIKNRSLDSQDTAIRIISLFIILSIIYIPVAASSIFGTFSAVGTAIPLLAIGFVCLFLSFNVKKVMLGKSEEGIRFDKSAFQI